MREIQASDAKARLSQLLDDVERGESLIITRHGRAIARIVPEVNRRQEQVDRALASIRELRDRTVKVTLEEDIVCPRGRSQVLMPFVLDASVPACWALQD